MTENEIDSGFELVLDNRRLIVAFVVFIAICGCFFVLGYSTGKRQGKIAVAGSVTGAGPEAGRLSSMEADTTGEEVEALKPDEIQKDLEWYQSVNKKTDESAGVQPARASSVSKKKAATSPDPVIYTVQVGAFKTRSQANAHAADIESKGFETRVEPPEPPGRFYLVKVGKFNTRPEAVAVQRSLKKSGIDCYVKIN